jgi:fructokinase
VFTVVGEALLDMVQVERGGDFAARPGGGPMNIAIGLQRLGHPTELMARLSTGALGAIVREHVERNGVGLAAAVSTDEQTTLAFASLDEHGRATYDFYVHDTADWGWTITELDRLPPTTQVIHTGSLATAIEPAADAIASLLERLHDAGAVLTSYDPNVRPALVGSRTAAVTQVERLVRAAHVAKASDEDLGWLYPGIPAQDSLHRWSEMGPALVVMTRGPDGCVGLVSGGEPVPVPGRQVQLVDTIGAGDSFSSALLSGLADAGCATPATIGGVTSDVLERVLSRATLAAALTCQRAGADPPTRAELDEAEAGSTARH